jgi:hypothetical protein
MREYNFTVGAISSIKVHTVCRHNFGIHQMMIIGQREVVVKLLRRSLHAFITHISKINHRRPYGLHKHFAPAVLEALSNTQEQNMTTNKQRTRTYSRSLHISPLNITTLHHQTSYYALTLDSIIQTKNIIPSCTLLTPSLIYP